MPALQRFTAGRRGRALVMAITVTGSVVFPHAQSPATVSEGTRFDVASIRRNVSGSGSMTVGLRGGRWIAVNTTPLTVVMNAYPYEPFRILDAPGWMSSERYDITAVAATEPDRVRLQAMLRALLTERFAFAAHVETRMLQTYALVPARGDGRLGPQLKPWTLDCDALLQSGGLAQLPPPRTAADFAIPPPCGMRAGRGVYAAGGRSLAELASSLASELGAPVIDRTGLNGPFEIVLRWNPDPSAPGADPALPALVTAVQEQLGLKLEPRREAAEVLVIDRVERPTPD